MSLSYPYFLAKSNLYLPLWRYTATEKSTEADHTELRTQPQLSQFSKWMRHVEFQLSKKYLQFGLKTPVGNRSFGSRDLKIPSTPNPAYRSRYESSSSGSTSKPYVAFIWKTAIRLICPSLLSLSPSIPRLPFTWVNLDYMPSWFP